MSRPRLSVVVAAYDGLRTLPALVEALRRQTLPPDRYEVLLCDDGSTDGSAEWLASVAPGPNWLVLRQPNHGAAAARNLGLAWARGDVVAFTDSDCVPAPDWLETIDRAFAGDPALVAIEGRTTCETLPTSPFDHWIAIDAGGLWATCNAAYRRDALLALGGFDPRFHHGHEDTELALRARPLGPMRFEPALRVDHPPHRRPVRSVLASHRYWRVDMTLYECQPDAFRAGHAGRGPVRVILVQRGIRLPLSEIWTRRRFVWTRPLEMLLYVAALGLSRVRLVLDLPEILREWRRVRADY